MSLFLSGVLLIFLLASKLLLLNNGKGDKIMNANFEPAEDNEKPLEKYGSDLTALARTGKLDPVIGRDTEIRDVIRILSRKTKNNPVLIGEPGVGKTAIVEGLAQRIVRGDVPEGLKDRTVFALDMTAPSFRRRNRSTTTVPVWPQAWPGPLSVAKSSL